MHHQYVVPRGRADRLFRNAAAMFLCSFAFFLGLGFRLSVTLVKIILGAAHISNLCRFPKRAVWLARFPIV